MKNTRAQEHKITRAQVLIACGVVICVMVLAVGCGAKRRAREAAAVRPATASEETGMRSRMEQAEKENAQLKKQVETLGALPGGKRAEAVYKIQRIEIGNYTNIYKEEEDGNKEKLIVYVSPIDETGDSVKAAGEVKIQLWDLSKKENNALLGEWTVEPNELKKMWYNSLISSKYRLSFDVSGVVKNYKAGSAELTVKVNFVDYLSGRTFSEQKVIKP
jgi:hypothetical protein